MEDYEILVEATIKSIFLDAENKSLTLDLDCSWGKKDRKRLIVSGVDDFSLTNMRIQNIFDHIKIYDSK